ncbi:MAG: bacterioferritin-associated ferredoxin [Woeseiaceae bacterium]
MYVCICNAVTDREIHAAAEAGVEDLWALQKELGVATQCGSCRDGASRILSEHRTAAAAQPALYRPKAG